VLSLAFREGLSFLSSSWDRGATGLTLGTASSGQGLGEKLPPDPHFTPPLEHPSGHRQQGAESPPAPGVIALRTCSNHGVAPRLLRLLGQAPPFLRPSLPVRGLC